MILERDQATTSIWAALAALTLGVTSIFGQESETKPLSWALATQQISQNPAQTIQAPTWIQCQQVATLNKNALPAKAQFTPKGSLIILEKIPVPQANQPPKGRLSFLDWNPRTTQFDISPRQLEKTESILDFAADNTHLFLVTPGKIITQSLEDNQPKETTLLEYTHSNGKTLGGVGLQAFADGWLFFTMPEGIGTMKASNQKEFQLQGCGGLYRIRKDGSRLETFCTGIASPLDGYFQDSKGHQFLADTQPGKVMGFYSVHQGADFGFRTRDFLAKFAMNDPAQFAEGLPGKLSPSYLAREIQPFSIFHYQGNGFPPEIQDYCFLAEPLEKRLTATRVRKTNSAVFLDKPLPFLECKPNLEPIQMVQGPDGSIYALCNPAASGVNREGALLRLSFKGETAAPKGLNSLEEASKAAKSELSDLVKTLEQFPEEQNIHMANWFARHLPGKKEDLCKLALDEEKKPSIRAAVFTALASHWDVEIQKTAISLLESGENILIVLATRSLGDFGNPRDSTCFNALLRHLGSDNNPLRREIILAIGKINAEGTADSLVNGVLFYDGNDPLVMDAFTRSLEFTGNDGLDRLNSVGDSGVKKDLRKALDVLGAMRDESAVPAIETWLKNVNLTSGDRAELIRSLRFHSMSNEKPFLALFESVIRSKPAKAEEKIAVLESLRGLKEIQSDGIRNWVEECLKDDSAETRKAAADTVRTKKMKNLKGPVSYKALRSCPYLG